MIAFETAFTSAYATMAIHQNSTHLIAHCNQSHLKIEYYRFFLLEFVRFKEIDSTFAVLPIAIK